MGVTYDTEALTQRQMENEERIIDGGIRNYRKAIATARAKGKFDETLAGRWLISNFIDPIQQRIKAFVQESVSGKPGPQAIGAAVLNRLEYDACAYIAIRVIVNSITDSKGAHERASILSRIVKDLIEEMRHNHMADEKTQTYKYWMKQIQMAPDRMTKKRCMDRLKKNFSSLPDFKTDAEKEAVAAAAAFLIQAAIDTTGIARVVSRVKHQKNGPKTPDFLELSPHYHAKIEALHDRAESLWPKFEPMLCPPRPWAGAFGGGFVGKLGERTLLVRTGNRSYLEDIHNNIGRMDKVLAALNAVQATPWRINQRVFDIMIAAFEGNGQQYGLPATDPLPKPIRPADIRTNRDAAKQYVSDIKAMQRLEKKRESRCRTVRFLLDTARKYRDEAAIWFAHNLDWRGRIYPLSSYLSPQGEELHRAVLEFAEGLPLETEEAVEWLAIHGAGCFGYDKVSFADRVKWVHDHEEQIRRSAESPLDYLWWAKEADKPWMFLAWCIDWVGYLDNGKAHISRLPVAMDGSCNGLQNFAAMLKHEETARAVNLAPSDLPNDIYQQVADKVKPVVADIAIRDPRPDDAIKAEAEARTEREYADADRVQKEKSAIEKRVKDGAMTKEAGRKALKKIKPTISAEHKKRTAELWDTLSARWIKDHITRKLVKRPVMTYPYSVTLYGMRDQLVEVLLDMHGEGVTSYQPAHVGKVASMLKTVVFEAIQETVVAAARAMEWLRTAAKVVAENNLPVTWVSPVGMLVVQNYWKSTAKRLSVWNAGIRYQPVVSFDKEDEVNVGKQASGVAPNFVHSCDASHLMYTVLACREKGLDTFHMIHDSFGCHASNAATLAATLREQFIAIYGDGLVLSRFYDQLRSQVADRPELAEDLLPPPAPEDFDLSLVRESKYFFA